MVLESDTIKAIVYTIVIIILTSLSISIYYQSTQASCDKCLFALDYKGASDELDYVEGKIHPNDMVYDLTKDGCKIYNKLQ